jgi:hypothetical protein
MQALVLFLLVWTAITLASDRTPGRCAAPRRRVCVNGKLSAQGREFTLKEPQAAMRGILNAHSTKIRPAQ